MPWFQQLCRNLGLMVHNMKHPEPKPPPPRVVNKTVEEKRIDDNVTLRRTTIDEVEVRPRDGSE